MANLTQLAAQLNLEGVAGDPFAVQATISLFDQNNNPIAFGNLTNPVVTVYEDGLPVAADAPTVTVGSNGYQLTWSSAQTADIAARDGATWVLQATLSGNQFAMLAGTLTMVSPNTPGGSNSASASLTVYQGQNVANITVQLGSYTGGGGGGSITLVQNVDGTVTVGGGSGPTVTVSRAAITGDVSVPAGSDTATLAASGVTAGSYGDGAHTAPYTVDAKGRLTASASTSIQIAESQVTNLTTDLAAKAPLASPALTGTPTAPTAVGGTNTTQLATTAFVQSALGGLVTGVSSVFGRSGAVTAQSGDYSVGQVTGAAPLASPALTGTPTAPTAAPSTNTTQIATTAFVEAALPTSLPPSGAASGDLSGSYPNPTVAKLQGNAVKSGVPASNGLALVWVSGNSDWEPTAVVNQVNGSTGNVSVVGSLAAADASIVVGGTATAPTVSRAALTGDITAPAGSNATTLKNTGPGAGSSGDASHTNTVTIDAQGRVTGLVGNAIQIAEAAVTNLVSDLAARLVAANNLSDLTNAATARTNLNLPAGSGVDFLYLRSVFR